MLHAEECHVLSSYETNSKRNFEIMVTDFRFNILELYFAEVFYKDQA